MDWLIEAISENFNAVLSGFFAIVGTFFGWLLNQLSGKYNNRPQLTFEDVGTPDDKLIESELRTKTSPSEWSIRIYNVGRTVCFLKSFIIMRKGHVLVECYDVCDNDNKIAPNSSILYTLMQQDASAMQRNYSKQYKQPGKAYRNAIRLLRNIPIIRNHIVDPSFEQGKCKVIAYDINGKRIYGKIDLPLLYFRHTARDVIIGK